MISPTSELSAALEAGATLPADWYSDPDVLALERERIFAGTWQCVGHGADVADPGTFLTGFAAHIPVVVVRGKDGELRGFVNVCRHRGHIVAQGSGRRATLQCPYHAWTYGLDGSLLNAPRCDREPGFDMEGLSLLPVAVETWGPLVFANPNADAEPLAATLGGLDSTIAESGLDLGVLRHRERIEWELQANWKVGLENYLECYHCPTAHPGFSKVYDVDPDSYLLRAEGLVSSQFGPVRDSAGNGGAGAWAKDGPVRQAQYHLVWPNLTLNIEAGPPNMSVDTWRPEGPDRTIGVTDYFYAEEVPEETVAEMIAFSTQVGDEDNALVESVQRGLASGMIPQGRLLPASEQLIQHFQRLVFDSLAG